jgi:hypothetical protein
VVLHRQDTYKGSPWQPWTQNLYTYVGNNPMNYVDPTGHEPLCADDGNGNNQICIDSNDVVVPATSAEEEPEVLESPLLLACISCTLGGRLVLIDENMNATGLYEALRQIGYNVITMKQAGLPVGKGFPDPKIIEWARQHGAYILTQNVKDFKKVYDLVIGAKNGWSVEQTVARMTELKRQFEANPQSLDWLKYISLMEAGKFVPPAFLRMPFFFMLNIRDPETGRPIWMPPDLTT